MQEQDKLFSKIKEDLRKNHNEKRYQHILGVVETSRIIGSHYKLDLTKLTLAALLHDLAKYFTLDELLQFSATHNLQLDPLESVSHGLLHGKVSRYLAQELYQISDPDILNAISSHTTGHGNMSIYEELIYIADYCEPSRKLSDSNDIIHLALENLSEAMFQVLSQKLLFVLQTQRPVHPKSIEAYNHYQSIRSII